MINRKFNIVFSPTGGTQKIVDSLGNLGVGSGSTIDLMKQDLPEYAFKEDDLCVIAVPSYGGRVPAVALKRLSFMKAAGTKAVLVVSYGNRDYDDTLLELKEQMVRQGFVIVACVCAIAEHSIMRQYAAGRPDRNDLTMLKEFGEKITEKLKMDHFDDIAVKGNPDYKTYNGVPLKPESTKNCTQCGACASRCPVGAIPFDQPQMTKKNLCISCMACIAVCPNNARKLPALLLKGASLKLKKECSVRKENELLL